MNDMTHNFSPPVAQPDAAIFTAFRAVCTELCRFDRTPTTDKEGAAWCERHAAAVRSIAVMPVATAEEASVRAFVALNWRYGGTVGNPILPHIDEDSDGDAADVPLDRAMLADLIRFSPIVAEQVQLAYQS